MSCCDWEEGERIHEKNCPTGLGRRKKKQTIVSEFAEDLRRAVDVLPAQNIRGYKTVRSGDVQDAINRVVITTLS